MVLLCVQGGGLRISGGTVTMISCNIYQNYANVSARLLPFPRHFIHRPIASTPLDRLTPQQHYSHLADRTYVLFAPQTPLCPLHRSNGMTCGAPVCAGRRARHLRWYCDDDELFRVLEHSYIRERSPFEPYLDLPSLH